MLLAVHAVHVQIVSAQIVSGTNCIGTNCIGTMCIGTICIGHKLYQEQIASGTNCIGSLYFFYPFILFLMHRIPNQKIPNHKKFLIVNNRH
jgi:hypothetical protein